MPNTRSSIPWGLEVDWLLRYLNKHEVTTEDIREVVSSPLNMPRGNYLPIDDYLHLFAWAAKRLKSPHIGLDIAAQTSTEDLGIYGYLIQNAPTLEALINVIVKYQSIFMRGMQFSTNSIGDEAHIEWRIFRPFDKGVQQDVEFTLAVFLRMIRLKLGDVYSPIRVSFRHQGSTPIRVYRKHFGTAVHFNQETDKLILNRADMGLPLAGSDPDLLAILMEQANLRLEESSNNNSLIEFVKLRIATSLQEGSAGLEAIAGSLNCTSRTLERRLARENSSYKLLRDQLILEMASEALSGSNANIDVIASKLGYSESSAFVRAFKRLTGFTPARYRSKIRDGSPMPELPPDVSK